MRDEDKWKCPFCGQIAGRVRESICDARDCACGAVGLGAPAEDWDEVTDEAIGIFGVAARAESRGLDHLLRADIASAGVEMREGVRDPNMGHPLGSGYVYTWFRRQPREGSMPESATIPWHRRWWFALVVCTAGQFLAWCVVDVFYVRLGLRSLEHLLWAAPPLAIFVCAVLVRPRAYWLAKAVALGLASTFLCFPLVLYLGVWFHFAIGGSL